MKKRELAATEQTAEQACKIAMALLSRRDHCQSELLQKMKLRGFSEDLAQIAVEYCQKHGWLNEANYARVYVRQRAQKGYGARRIYQELQQRVLDEDDISLAFSEFDQEHEWDWFESARHAREKRFGLTRAAEYKEKQKQKAWLYRRGFCSDEIEYALENR